jgi:hypothetical protein
MRVLVVQENESEFISRNLGVNMGTMVRAMHAHVPAVPLLARLNSRVRMHAHTNTRTHTLTLTPYQHLSRILTLPRTRSHTHSYSHTLTLTQGPRDLRQPDMVKFFDGYEKPPYGLHCHVIPRVE